MNIVLVSGKIKAGKDYLGDHLVKIGGYKKLAYAEYLKYYTCEKYNLPIEYAHSHEYKHKNFDFCLECKQAYVVKGTCEHPDVKYHTLRDELIICGDYLRSVNVNVFAEHVISNILELQAQGHMDFVICDFRFPNEYEQLRSFFGVSAVKTIRVSSKDSDSSEFNRNHTETSLDKFQFDYYLFNDKTAEFNKTIESIHRLLK